VSTPLIECRVYPQAVTSAVERITGELENIASERKGRKGNVTMNIDCHNGQSLTHSKTLRFLKNG
jgi:hypothetical protein